MDRLRQSKDDEMRAATMRHKKELTTLNSQWKSNFAAKQKEYEHETNKIIADSSRASDLVSLTSLRDNMKSIFTKEMGENLTRKLLAVSKSVQFAGTMLSAKSSYVDFISSTSHVSECLKAEGKARLSEAAVVLAALDQSTKYDEEMKGFVKQRNEMRKEFFESLEGVDEVVGFDSLRELMRTHSKLISDVKEFLFTQLKQSGVSRDPFRLVNAWKHSSSTLKDLSVHKNKSLEDQDAVVECWYEIYLFCVEKMSQWDEDCRSKVKGLKELMEKQFYKLVEVHRHVENSVSWVVDGVVKMKEDIIKKETITDPQNDVNSAISAIQETTAKVHKFLDENTNADKALLVLMGNALVAIFEYEIKLHKPLVRNVKHLVDKRKTLGCHLEATKDVESLLAQLEGGVDSKKLRKKIAAWKMLLEDEVDEDEVASFNEKILNAEQQLQGGNSKSDVFLKLYPHLSFLPELKIIFRQHLAHSADVILSIPSLTLHHDFKDLKPLSEEENGGRHLVFSAKNTSGKKFALKQYVIDENNKRTFFKEANVLQRLTHPNIVSLEGIVNNEHSTFEKYLLMPFYEKGDLETWWAKSRYPNGVVDMKANQEQLLGDFLNVVMGCLRGLQHIHANGVIHCDIKPANIMMKNDFTPVLVDFDISLSAQGRARTAVFTQTRVSQMAGARGTIGFIAPELFPPHSSKPTTFCDVYSFGATVVWMMFGIETLLQSETLDDVKEKVKGFDGLCDQPDLNDLLVSLVLKMTEELPTDRPTAVEALSDDFVLRGLPHSKGHHHHLMDTTTSTPTVAIPPNWTVVQGAGTMHQRVDVTDSYKDWVSDMLNNTSIKENIGTGNDGSFTGELYNHFEVMKVERVENAGHYKEFTARRSTITNELKGRCPPMPKPPVTHNSNVVGEYDEAGLLQTHESGEYLLFHGVKDEETVEEIARTGFDNRFNERGMFGTGAYFAENANKADEYTMRTIENERFIVIGRVVLGDVHYENVQQEEWRHPPLLTDEEKMDRGDNLLYNRHHSVVANTTKEDARAQLRRHREFVVYERSQSYPELIVTYKRVQK
eukprot:m.239047 g.239047  ORF g.239047 m.239047 type:complete len:1059 (+) comp13933_c0_seq1:404-3580(+)